MNGEKKNHNQIYKLVIYLLWFSMKTRKLFNCQKKKKSLISFENRTQFFFVSFEVIRIDWIWTWISVINYKQINWISFEISMFMLGPYFVDNMIQFQHCIWPQKPPFFFENLENHKIFIQSSYCFTFEKWLKLQINWVRLTKLSH